jgi:hypothetical protein
MLIASWQNQDSAFKFACENQHGAAAAGKLQKRRHRAFLCHADFTKLQ